MKTKSINNNYLNESNEEKSRAPLLETISTLTNSLIYSDHSSNSSLSNPDELEHFDSTNNQFQCQSLLKFDDDNDEFNVISNDLIEQEKPDLLIDIGK